MTLLDRAAVALNDREAAIARQNRRKREERDARLRRDLLGFADVLSDDPAEPLSVDPFPEEEAAEIRGVTPRFVTEVDGTRVGIALDGRILFQWFDPPDERGWFSVDVRGKTGDDLLVEIARAHARALDARRQYRERVSAAARRDETAETRWRPRTPPDLVEEAEAALANPSVVDQTHALSCAVLALVGQVDRIALAAEIRDAT